MQLLIALAVGVGCGTLSFFGRRSGWFEFADFDQLWIAARVLRAGGDPYAAVASAFPWPLYYPLPAVLVAVPFSYATQLFANALFVGFGSAIFAFAIAGERFVYLLALVSYAFLYAIERGQWSPALIGATLLPSLGFLLAAKPTIAVALFVYRPSVRAAILAATILVISIVIMPTWPFAWRNAIQSANHVRAPIAYLGGPLLLLLLWRWRRPETRLILALACVPQTFVAYETLPLFLVVRTRIEGIVLVTGSLVAERLSRAAVDATPDLAATVAARAPYLLLCMYGPALLMVLRRKNEGRLPLVIERVVARLPASLRGSEPA